MKTVILIGLISFIFVLMWLLYKAHLRESAKWNGGYCSSCNVGEWREFDVDSAGGRGYTCDHCSEYIWISSNLKKQKQRPRKDNEV